MILINSADAAAGKDYAEKNEQVDITFTITDNAPYNVKNFEIISTVDGKDTTALYDVATVSENGSEGVYKGQG